MKKKFFAVMLAAALAFVPACGSSSGEISSDSSSSEDAGSGEEAEEEAEPLDLTGNWVEEDPSDTYHAACISGDVIEIYWIMDEGETVSLYWSGSYEAPQEAADTYTWDSVNNTARTGSALLASGDDTKTFTYEGGKLSYSATALGTTRTVYMVVTDTDYSGYGVASGEAEAVSYSQVELTDSGYAVYESDYYTYIFYAAELYNPNENYAIEYPVIQITARSAEGSILTTDEQTLMAIAAGDTYVYAGYITYEGEAADTVEISVSNDTDYAYVFQDGSSIVYSSDLSVFNTSEIVGSYDRSYTGEITNGSTEDLDMAAVVVVYYSGDSMVGGEVGYVDGLASGETKAFEVSAYSGFDGYDSYEIHAIQW